jgi:hypothetical protein
MERIDLNSVSCLLNAYDMTEWKQLEHERERLIDELQEALGNIKTLYRAIYSPTGESK